MAVGEAVIFFDRALSEEFAYRCKQAGQLASKMRFLAAPWVGLLRSGAWLRNGRQANQMAQRLHGLLAAVPGVQVLRPPQANSVFVHLPPGVGDAVRARGWRFYDFIAGAGSRLMTAWDTTDADLAAFAGDLREVLGAPIR
jgi:threonine aldolase